MQYRTTPGHYRIHLKCNFFIRIWMHPYCVSRQDRLLQAGTEICAFEIYRRGKKRRVILYFAGSRASWRSQWHLSGETWEAVSLETFFFLVLNDESLRSEEQGNRRWTKYVSEKVYSLLWMPNSNITQQECWTVWMNLCVALLIPYFSQTHSHKCMRGEIKAFRATSNILFYNRFY